jgi:hypothetical protein
MLFGWIRDADGDFLQAVFWARSSWVWGCSSPTGRIHLRRRM